jgi:hypothetical protein
MTSREKIFSKDTFNKELLPKLYKELFTLNNEKAIQLKNGQKT